MKDLLNRLFGEACNDALIIHIDGKEWVSSRSLCDLMGVADEYHVVYDQKSWPEMNLSREDARQFEVEGAHLPCPIWFVSETGIWKIIARSHNPWARRFRASFLPM